MISITYGDPFCLSILLSICDVEDIGDVSACRMSLRAFASRMSRQQKFAAIDSGANESKSKREA
jgi:hypothetical protein